MIDKNIFLLGATGSIGTQVLEVIRGKDFCLKSVACGKNINKLEEIILEFHPEYVSVLYKDDAEMLQKKYPNIIFGYGDKGLEDAATYKEKEKGTVINAVVGLKGLMPTIKAIKLNRDILLANKETLVVGGSIINDLLKKHTSKLIPVDSEHNAIARLIDGYNKDDIKKIIITASGGAFLNKTREELSDVSVCDALNHPNWQMGSKITIDSATMVNKGLEVIEAYYLFGLDIDKIETIIHPESIIHGMVEFNDHSVKSLMYKPSMVNPIEYAIYGKEINGVFENELDFSLLEKLTFKRMDYQRFPMIKLAYDVIKKGGILPLVYNASNEASVELFLKGKIKFLDIERIITKYVNKYFNYELENELTIDEIIKLDSLIKDNIINEVIKK